MTLKAIYTCAAVGAFTLLQFNANAEPVENDGVQKQVAPKQASTEKTTFVGDTDYDFFLAPADFDAPGQVKSFADLYKLSAEEKKSKVLSWGDKATPSNNFQYNQIPFGFNASYGFYRIPGTEGPNSRDNTKPRGVDFKMSYKDLKKTSVGLQIAVNDTRASEKAADNKFDMDLTIPREGLQLIKLGPPLKGQQAWIALQINKIVESVPPSNVSTDFLPGDKVQFKFTAADGSQIDTAKMRGKVILVDYWATWCGPCVEALPRLEELYTKYHARGFEIIGINIDDNRAIMDRFLRANKHPWPQSISAEAGKNPLFDPFKFKGIPGFLLIDKNGVYSKIEARNADTDAKIEALLNK